jgi:hypothetical protein
MPLYEWTCADGHLVERMRRYGDRDLPETCHCGKPSTRVEISKVHCSPDGIYSYAPNLGSEQAFERKRSAIRNGERIYKKETS